MSGDHSLGRGTAALAIVGVAIAAATAAFEVVRLTDSTGAGIAACVGLIGGAVAAMALASWRVDIRPSVPLFAVAAASGVEVLVHAADPSRWVLTFWAAALGFVLGVACVIAYRLRSANRPA